MLGAIIGDLAGSIYEFGQVKNTKPVSIQKIIEDDAFFSDDTILTMAIVDAILSGRCYEEKLKAYAILYEDAIPKDRVYFKKMFSPVFLDWVKGDSVGTSLGNGAMMRISPVGFLFNTEEDVKNNAKLATIPSHNSELSLKFAETIALLIFYLRQGLSKDQAVKKLKLKIQKPEITKFNYTCEDTIDVCLYSWYHSTNFEDALRLCISFGGDTDTNACIVGGIAEATYGLPLELVQKAKTKLPEQFVKLLEKAYECVAKGVEKIGNL